MLPRILSQVAAIVTGGNRFFHRAVSSVVPADQRAEPREGAQSWWIRLLPSPGALLLRLFDPAVCLLQEAFLNAQAESGQAPSRSHCARGR